MVGKAQPVKLCFALQNHVLKRAKSVCVNILQRLKAIGRANCVKSFSSNFWVKSVKYF